MSLSQEEIDALLGGSGGGDESAPDEDGTLEAIDSSEELETGDTEAAEEQRPRRRRAKKDADSEFDAVDESTGSDGADDSSLDVDSAASLDAVDIDSAVTDSEVSGEHIVNVTSESAGPEYFVSPEEADTLGEIGNICMGAVATTMFTLLGRRVSITTPRVSIHTTKEVLSVYQVPFVVVEVEYVEGINGKNMLLLKESDAALITDLLLGGDGQVEEPIELTELHMSAISEIMNQMIGASATSLSEILNVHVNISTPTSNRVQYYEDVSDRLDYSDIVVKIQFDMEIEGLLKSQLLQLTPYTLAKKLASQLLGETEAATAEAAAVLSAAHSVNSAAQQDSQAHVSSPTPSQTQPPNYVVDATPQQVPGYAPAPGNAYPPSTPGYGQPQAPGYPQAPAAHAAPVSVHAMQFSSFDAPQPVAIAEASISMISDIPLQVSVELGKTRRQISDVLEFGMGTVVVLDKIAGDPVEVLVNGKTIARGEVVVIEESYGVRITEIVGG